LTLAIALLLVTSPLTAFGDTYLAAPGTELWQVISPNHITAPTSGSFASMYYSNGSSNVFNYTSGDCVAGLPVILYISYSATVLPSSSGALEMYAKETFSSTTLPTHYWYFNSGATNLHDQISFNDSVQFTCSSGGYWNFQMYWAAAGSNTVEMDYNDQASWTVTGVTGFQDFVSGGTTYAIPDPDNYVGSVIDYL
jgi:hypothetical protein